jgi:hypothetical protein
MYTGSELTVLVAYSVLIGIIQAIVRFDMTLNIMIAVRGAITLGVYE